MEYKNNLIRNKKLLLVLDLDNTILHSIARKKVDD
jgi:predicted secreted acid phosphatase